MDFARELKRLHDEGWDYAQIARVACKTENYIRDYIRLVEQGEERLIQGVEQGVFPIKFATQVAATDNGQIQNVLMDAFDEGIVTTDNFAQARQIIMARAREHKGQEEVHGASTRSTSCKQDIADGHQGQGLLRAGGQEQGEPLLDAADGDQRAVAGRRVRAAAAAKRSSSERPELAGDFALRIITSNH